MLNEQETKIFKIAVSIFGSRTFDIAYTDCCELTTKRLTINQIIAHSVYDDFEFCHALLENNMDQLLNTPEGESFVFKPNRDEKNSTGFAVRVFQNK